MVPQIDYTALATQMLPSAQRLPNFEAMTSALLSQSARCYSIFQEYMNTQPAATVWAVGTDYIGIGTRVWYQFGIYESLLASNLGNVPSTTPAAWILRNQFAVGAVQRTMYRPSCIGLTWALNDYFSIQIAAASLPGFKQPPWEPPYDFGTGSGSGYSTIYVLPDVPAYPSFLIGLTESTSDSVGTTSSSGFIGTTEVFTTASSYSFVVYIPTAVWDLLGSSDAIRTAVVNEFVNNYTVCGVVFSITVY